LIVNQILVKIKSENYLRQMRTGQEKWKRIKFPKEYVSHKKLQISNFGRVREVLPCGAIQEKRRIIKDYRISYKFKFRLSSNVEKSELFYINVKQLVASHFVQDFYQGCCVVHKDHNRLNNYYRNLIILNKHDGISYMAKGKLKNHEQFFVMPPDKKEEKVSELHKVEIDNDYFKTLPDFPNYEINRFGKIRRRKAPFIGREMKARMHPDKFYFVELRNPLRQRKTIYIHKAVATVWNINSNPELQTVVVHLDGNTLNNHADNLEWMSPSGAMKLQFKHKKRDNRKSWKTRKKLYGNGFKKNKIQEA
jgi:hypothetical protein